MASAARLRSMGRSLMPTIRMLIKPFSVQLPLFAAITAQPLPVIVIPFLREADWSSVLSR